MDPSDMPPAPAPQPGTSDTLGALVAQPSSSNSFALGATGIRMEAEPAGLDETSDGSSGGSRDGPRGPSSVVSVAGDNLLGSVLGERYRLENESAKEAWDSSTKPST